MRRAWLQRLALTGGERAYRNQSVSEIVDRARSLGLKALELWYPWNIDEESADDVIRTLEEKGMEVACVSTWAHLYLPSGVEEERRKVQTAISLAHRLRAPLVNTYFGHGETPDDQLAIKTYVDNLQSCLERAEESGVTICLENEFDVLGDDPLLTDVSRRPESLRQLVESIDSPRFKLTFDPCNFYFAGVEPFPYAYEVLAPYIGHIHLKDGARYMPPIHGIDVSVWTDHTGPYVCLPLGQGAINYAGLLRKLVADSYDGYLTLEPHVEAGRIDATLVQSMAFIQALEAPVRADDRYRTILGGR